MNRLTKEQVSAALETAGMTPIATPESIAASLSAQLEATAAAFAEIPFEAEPCTFTALLWEHA